MYTVRRIAYHNPWLVEPRPNRGGELAGVMIHATRSGRSDGDDGPRTERWMQNPANNQGGWGSSCDEIVFESGERVLVSNYEREAPTYGAGFGAPGSWSAGWYYYQVEVAQGMPADDYTEPQIDSLARRVAELARKHGFPLARIGHLRQTGTPQPGICTHEASDNGVRLGKSDPGERFPWERFLALANRYLAGSGEEEAVKVYKMRGRKESSTRSTASSRTSRTITCGRRSAHSRSRRSTAGTRSGTRPSVTRAAFRANCGADRTG